jgi:DNA-binding IclR family transcriptional regulator
MTSQSLDRGVILLRCLSTAGRVGHRLVDLQRETGLTKPTVHRLLTSLRSHGLVEQDQLSKRYRLGREIIILAWPVMRHLYDLKQIAEESMTAIASETGDTSFLSIRSGYESICIDRQSGSYPVKAFTVDVGTRRPLGIGATGIILLAALEGDRYSAAITSIKFNMGPFVGISLRQITEAVSHSRRTGFAVSNDMVLKGVAGVAVGIRNPNRSVVAAIGIAAIKERISRERQPELIALLRRHTKTIERRLVFETKASLL